MVATRSLEALGLAGDPMAAPLSYPGALPGEDGVLVDGCYLPLKHAPGRQVGDWRVEIDGTPVELDVLLEKQDRPITGNRFPVVSVGSNAAPAQLHGKFVRKGVRPLVPLVNAKVFGMAAGISAHVSRAGYIPGTGVLQSGGAVSLFVAWLDADELQVIDASELNYYRVLLDGSIYPVLLPSGERLGACSLYVSKWGCLVGRDGNPRPLSSQNELLATLLAESRVLRRIFGDTPESFVARAAADASKRDEAKQIFRREGWVRPQRELEQLRERPVAEQTYAASGSYCT
jgi:hypothetical protein